MRHNPIRLTTVCSHTLCELGGGKNWLQFGYNLVITKIWLQFSHNLVTICL